MTLQLRPLTPDAPYFASAVAVYTEYVATNTPRYHAQFFESHSERTGYIGLVAQLPDEPHAPSVVGIAFGSACMPGQWWHDKVADQIDADHSALQDAWTLTQLNVLEAYRNRGIGSALHDAILAQQTARHALLSTQVSNGAAQRFYKRHGWRVLHPGFIFSAGDEPYMIMHYPPQP